MNGPRVRLEGYQWRSAGLTCEVIEIREFRAFCVFFVSIGGG